MAAGRTPGGFRLSPLGNRALQAGTLSALGIHLAALHVPFSRRILGIEPIAPSEWLLLGALASVIVVVMEIHKKLRQPRGGAPDG